MNNCETDKQNIENLITKQGFSTLTKPMDAEVLKDSPLIFIRHALSVYNFNSKMTRTDFGVKSAEFNATQKGKDFIDPDLHEIGLQQVELHQPIINNTKINIVFTSPIQRAMQTTIGLFKDHPNKQNIKFQVLPILREILNTANDVAIDVQDLMDKYCKGKEICEGIEFDFHQMKSLGQPQLWQIQSIADFNKQKVVLDKLAAMNIAIDENNRLEKRHFEALQSSIVENDCFEDKITLRKRGTQIKRFFAEQLKHQNLEENEKVVVITHSMTISSITAKGYDAEKDRYIDNIFPDNCQMLPFDFKEYE